MPQRSGWEARVKLGGLFYAVKTWRFETAVPDLDVSNTEGVAGNGLVAAPAIGYSGALPGLAKGTFTLASATFDDDNNPFAVPLLLRAGIYLAVQIFPARATGVSHLLPNCLIMRVTHEGDVTGLSPVTIEGTTDGAYSVAAT